MKVAPRTPLKRQREKADLRSSGQQSLAHPLLHSRPCGFALVIVLAILAMILILILSISSVLHVETRTSASGKNLLLARQNALLGLDTAIAQLQEYAGKDQAITFPATTYYPTKDLNVPGASYPAQGKGDIFDNSTYGFRKFAQTSSARSYLSRVETYLTPAERQNWDKALKDYWNANRNPYWIGIMDASLRVDRATNPNSAPVALPAQRFEAPPVGPKKFGEPKRDQLPVWLVSGNEKFTITGNMTSYPPGYQTPDTALPDPAGNSTVVWLVGNGTVANTSNASTDRMEPRVKARKVELKTTANGTATGHYAYWVGDESLKANFAVRDPFFNAAPGSIDYRNRLQSPQRLGWENMSANGTSSNNTLDSLATFTVDDPNLENITTSKEIALLEAAASGSEQKTSDLKEATKNNFHSLTAWSRSLLTDTTLGGLKKDLTAYLERGDGLNDSDPIPDRSLYETSGSGDPRFRAWNGTNSGFPNSASNDGLPLWGTVRDWYQNTAGGGSISPDENTAPVLSYIMLHAGLSYNPTTKRLNWHWLPAVVLWNPYDVSLQPATYNLEVQVAPHMWRFYLAKTNPTLAELQKDAGAQWAERPVGPLIDPNDPSKGRNTVWSFRATTPNPDFAPADPLRNFWPIIRSNNPKYVFSASGSSADHYDVGGKGPFAYDDNFADGTSDGFGRFFYNLKAVPKLSGKMRDPFRASGTRTGNATNSNFSSLGANSPEFGLRWNPHKNAGDGGNSLPTNTFLRLAITSAFAPGESKVFTYQNQNMPEWDPTSADVIPLSPGIDIVEPASIWFPVCEVVNGPDSADGLRFFTEFLQGNRLIPAVKLSINGKTIMENSSWGGDSATSQHIISTAYRDVAVFGSNSGGDMDGDAVTNQNEAAPKFLDRWRRVYAFTGSQTDEFQTKLSAYSLNKTGLADVPIWPFGEHFLTPVTADGTALKSDLYGNIPAFSRFNLGAKRSDLHPLLDRIRDTNGINNRNFANLLEGLGKFQYIKSFPNFSEPAWDNYQYDGNNGFSLIAYRNPPGPKTYQPLSQLPIRLARRPQSNVLSLGQLQQVNLSPYIWQPSFPVGNSWAGVYNDREAIAGIHSRSPGIQKSLTTRSVQTIPNSLSFTFNATNTETVEVPSNAMLDVSYLLNENLWDRFFLSTQKTGHSLNSPLANSRLRFNQYAASAATSERLGFDTSAAYLENFGALNVNSTSVEAWKALLTAFRDLSLGDNPDNTVPVARTLDPISGAITMGFNASGADINASHIGATATEKNYSRVLNGFRYLTDAMIQALAERIVDEIRLRGPFLSLADFVNRRLVAPQGSNQTGSAWFSARTNGWATNPNVPASSSNASITDSAGRQINLFLDYLDPSYDPFIGLHGISGTLQRAIDVSGINGGLNHPSLGALGNDIGYNNDSLFSARIRNAGSAVQPLGQHNSTSNQFTNAGIGKSTHTQTPRHTIEPTLRCHVDTEHLAGMAAGEAGHYFQGAPGFITQGDILAMIGPALTPRGDTFLIRTYGDAVDKNGRVLARAYLEAVVQRVAEPVKPKGTSGLDKWTPTNKFGRKFKVVSLRWLNPEEV